MSIDSAGTKDATDQEKSAPERVADVETAKKDLRTLYSVLRDPETQWYIPLLMLGVVIYAISPVDALPDVFPILGVLDEAVVFMLGRAAVYRFVPETHVEKHAQETAGNGKRRFTLGHLMGGIIVFQLAVLALALVFANELITSIVPL